MSRPSSRRPRVAFVTSVLAEYKLHLYRGLASLPDYEVMLWHGPQAAGATPADVDPGHALPHRSARNLHLRLGVPLLWQRVSAELWRFSPDLLVLEDGVRILSNVLLLAQARRRGVPVIYYSHGENLQRGLNRGRVLGELIERVREQLHRRAASLVVYTDGSARALRLRHPGRRVHVSRNTLDTRAIREAVAALPRGHRAAVRARLSVPDESLLVASVGRMIPEHDPRPAIDGLLRARREGADCHLLLVGSGPLDGAVDAYIAALDPAARAAIHRLPRQPFDETTRLLAACDVFLASGTIGLAIVHAFAVGLPFVGGESAYHGPETDYLLHGQNGLRLRDSDGDLVATLLRLRGDPQLRLRLAENAARFAREELSPEAQLGGFRAAFDEALGSGETARGGTAPPAGAAMQ